MKTAMKQHRIDALVESDIHTAVTRIARECPHPGYITISPSGSPLDGVAICMKEPEVTHHIPMWQIFDGSYIGHATKAIARMSVMHHHHTRKFAPSGASEMDRAMIGSR